LTIHPQAVAQTMLSRCHLYLNRAAIACPPGSDYPHQLINASAVDLHYLVVSTMEYPDLSAYPDSNKVGAYGTAAVGQKVGFRALYVRDKNVNYYEGEDGKEIERVLNSRSGA
jgi:uncharacterized cupin superfamily protein